jgi:hypothetical protein
MAGPAARERVRRRGSIEHEDSNYGGFGGPLELRQAGLREGLRVLRESMPR